MALATVFKVSLFLSLSPKYGLMNDICRSLRFTNTIPGVSLVNHVIADFTVEDEEHCQLKCYLEKSCFSYNYGPAWQGVHGFTCELNNVEASYRPDDLTPRDWFVYQTAEEICGNTVCPSYAVCRYDSYGKRDRCFCNPGTTQGDCEAIGIKKSTAVKSCKELKRLMPNYPTDAYWIVPDEGENVFQAYCDMETDGGGWTLVYSYTFTEYDKFMTNANAVTPFPNWPSAGEIPSSTTVPLNETHLAAMNFMLWRLLGTEFLVKSNINNWIACLPAGGSLVEGRNGKLTCRMIKDLTKKCADVIPNKISFGDCGVRLRTASTYTSSNLFYFFDICKGRRSPIHDPCGTSRDNYLKGVQNPHGNIFVR